MADKRVIYRAELNQKTVVIYEKTAPNGELLVEKVVEWTGGVKADLNAAMGMLEFLKNLKPRNLAQIESYRTDPQEGNVRLEVYMEPAVMSAEAYFTSQSGCIWTAEEMLVQLDGLIDVFEHVQKNVIDIAAARPQSH